MAWVPDSTTAGYLGPKVTPAPLEGDAWIDFLHDVVAGVTGLANELVRPRWQTEPPTHPEIGVDWAAIGITGARADWQPAIVHVDTGDGHDYFQRMEESTLLCTFYGPNSQTYASLLRDGLFIDQNAAALRSADVAVVEVQDFVRAPELFRQQYLDRTDVPVILRRAIIRQYPVLNLLSASGRVVGQGPGTHTVESDWTTE